MQGLHKPKETEGHTSRGCYCRVVVSDRGVPCPFGLVLPWLPDAGEGAAILISLNFLYEKGEKAWWGKGAPSFSVTPQIALPHPSSASKNHASLGLEGQSVNCSV